MAEKPAQAGGCSRTTLAVMIALIATLVAFVSWRAALAADIVGSENTAGLWAAMNLQEARSVNSAQLYRHYQAYTTYVRSKMLGDLLNRDSYSMDWQFEEQILAMQKQRDDAFDVASMAQYFFVTEYLNPDGSYNIGREYGSGQAEAAQQKDLNAQAHFDIADRQQARSSLMLGTLILFAAALWFYTLADRLKSVLKVVSILAGSGFLVLGVAAVTIIELFL